MTLPIRPLLTRVFLPVALAASLLQAAPARADEGFRNWIAKFYPVAAQAGITKATYRAAFAGVSEPDPDVLKKAGFQPEFHTKVWDYMDNHVNPYTVRIGQQMLKNYGPMLNAIERHFGVDKHILLAIWSMESNYGQILENEERLHNVPRALATLAYIDAKRAKFARTQLIAALKIVQSGDIPAQDLKGSWAGAMGHTQFIPTSYLLYGFDADGDGHRNIWKSVPDALATSANLLMKNGWTPGKTWGYEIAVPPGGAAYRGKTLTIGQWAQLGFTRPNGKGFKNPGERAMLKMPAGPDGPGFLMTKNFFVLKKYNAADTYALAVGLLADEIAGYPGMRQAWPRPEGSLGIKEKFELQSRMKELGYYSGEIDGKFGSGSKAAIATIQQRLGLQPDGEPSMQLLNALRQ